jgi:hypothetical protein
MTTMRPHPMGADRLRVVRLRVGSKIGLNAHLNPFGRRRPTPLDRCRPMPTISPDPTSRAPAPTSLRCLVTRNTPHSVGLFPPPVILTAVAKLPMPGSASSTLRRLRTLNILAGNVADMSRHVANDTPCRSNFGQMGLCRRHYFSMSWQFVSAPADIY